MGSIKAEAGIQRRVNMELLPIIFPFVLFSALEATLIDELKRIIEQNAIAPSFPGIARERCPRTAPQNQTQLVKYLINLLEVDLNLEQYITNGQVCPGKNITLGSVSFYFSSR